MLRARPAVERRLLGGDLLVRPLGGETVHLGGSAGIIWRVVVEAGSAGITRPALVALLAESHDADRSVIEADLEPALRRLREVELVEERG